MTYNPKVYETFLSFFAKEILIQFQQHHSHLLNPFVRRNFLLSAVRKLPSSLVQAIINEINACHKLNYSNEEAFVIFVEFLMLCCVKKNVIVDDRIANVLEMEVVTKDSFFMLLSRLSKMRLSNGGG